MSDEKVAFLQQKGGCGKTSLATTFAAWVHSLGYRVLVVDMDPSNYGVKDWMGEREITGKPVFPYVQMVTPSAILRDRENVDYLIIDGRPIPAGAETIAIAMGVDLVFIPTRDRRPDIRGGYGFGQDLVKKGVPANKIKMVVNQGFSEPQGRAAIQDLNRGVFEVVDGFIDAKTAYGICMDYGVAFFETKYESLNEPVRVFCTTLKSLVDRS